MSNDKVSIIIPVYNSDNYLYKLLNSVVNQTYKNIEIILINDGSTDNSDEICGVFALKDERIIYIKQANEGVSSARNKGIGIATGRYLVFIDSDDIPLKNYVEVLVNTIINKKVDLVYSSYRMIKNGDRYVDFVLNNELIDGVSLPKRIYGITKELPNAPWGKIFDINIIRNHYIRFPIGVPYAEDSIFLYKYLSHVKSICSISDITYYYSFMDNNSAARKFYVNFYSYIKARYDAMLDCLNSFEIENINGVCEKEALYCFNTCISHYMVNMKNGRKEQIKNAANTFGIQLFENQYAVYISQNRVDKVEKIWLKNNMVFFIKEKLKRLMRK